MSTVKKKKDSLWLSSTQECCIIKPWNIVHLDLIGTYSKSIIKQYSGGTTIKNNVSLSCMTMIDPDTGWFEMVKVTKFDLDEITGDNEDDIDKSDARLSQLFNSMRM